jgi:hypothetical protein
MKMINAIEDWDLREDGFRIPTISRSEDSARTAAAVRNSALGSSHSNILKKHQKIFKKTGISVIIDQLSCKNCPISEHLLNHHNFRSPTAQQLVLKTALL